MHYYYDKTETDTGFVINPIVYVNLVGALKIPLRQDGLTIPTDSSKWKISMMDRFIRAYRITMTEEMRNFQFVMFLKNITFVKRIRVTNTYSITELIVLVSLKTWMEFV